MSRKPRPGGQVQISGILFEVISAPQKDDNGFYCIAIRNADGAFWARSEGWRNGRGPWVIKDLVTAEIIRGIDFTGEARLRTAMERMLKAMPAEALEALQRHLERHSAALGE